MNPFLRYLVTGSLLAWALGARAQNPPSADKPLVPVTSSSEQFLVRGLMQMHHGLIAKGDNSLILLDPSLVAISAERVREALQLELGLTGKWRGQVIISIHPVRRDRQQVVIQPMRHEQGRSYLVDLPDEIEPERLIRVLVEVLLNEYASRFEGDQPIELPPWLAPGLSAHLAAGPLEGIIILSDRPVTKQGRQNEARLQLRDRLQPIDPLSVDQLCWPTPAQQHGDGEKEYTDCAHLFIRELLRLPDGPACFQRMLQSLSRYYNWQTAFINAFGGHFHSLRDAEQWWLLQLTHFLGRNPLQVWTPNDSLRRLEDILYTPVEVRLQTNDLPHPGVANLQTIIKEWDWRRQEPLLVQKVNLLANLQAHLAGDSSRLAEDYRRVISSYLVDRSRVGAAPERRGPPAPNALVLSRDAVGRLNGLDVRREQARKNVVPRGGITTNSLPQTPAPAGPALGAR